MEWSLSAKMFFTADPVLAKHSMHRRVIPGTEAAKSQLAELTKTSQFRENRETTNLEPLCFQGLMNGMCIAMFRVGNALQSSEPRVITKCR